MRDTVHVHGGKLLKLLNVMPEVTMHGQRYRPINTLVSLGHTMTFQSWTSWVLVPWVSLFQSIDWHQSFLYVVLKSSQSHTDNHQGAVYLTYTREYLKRYKCRLCCASLWMMIITLGIVALITLDLYSPNLRDTSLALQGNTLHLKTTNAFWYSRYILTETLQTGDYEHAVYIIFKTWYHRMWCSSESVPC